MTFLKQGHVEKCSPVPLLPPLVAGVPIQGEYKLGYVTCCLRFCNESMNLNIAKTNALWLGVHSDGRGTSRKKGRDLHGVKAMKHHTQA